MACAASYCLLYIYERVTWTAKAKHDAFRRQYISYATSQLGMIAGIATEHCSSQVERYYLRSYRAVAFLTLSTSITTDVLTVAAATTIP